MNEGLEQELLKAHPVLYPDLKPRWDDAPHFECEDGWGEILKELSARLDRYAATDGLAVVLVKQKFGGLYVYTELQDDARAVDGKTDANVRRWLDEATRKSLCTCELCGGTGRRRYKGRARFVQVLCDPCTVSKGYAT